MINLNKLKNRFKTMGLVLGVATVLTACTATGSYWGSDLKYGVGNADFYYVGSGFNAWDRVYYGDGSPHYYNRVNWVGYYDLGGGFHPSYYYYYRGAR